MPQIGFCPRREDEDVLHHTETYTHAASVYCRVTQQADLAAEYQIQYHTAFDKLLDNGLEKLAAVGAGQMVDALAKKAARYAGNNQGYDPFRLGQRE